MSLRIAIDVSPLLAQRTGIGCYIENLIEHLVPLKSDCQWRFFAVPRTREREIIFNVGQENLRAVIKPWVLPARVTSVLLQFTPQSLLTVENFVGPSDLFHWTNFLSCAQRLGKKIVTVHDITFYLFPEFHPLKRRMVFKAFFRRSLDQADHIIAVSQNTKNDLIKHFQVPANKISVIHLAADPRFGPVGSEEARGILSKFALDYGRYLLYVGTLEPRKNLLRLVKAYDLFRANSSGHVPLVLGGSSGWLNDDIQRQIDQSAWKQDIKVLGYVDKADLPALYSGALIFIYPSLYEGFGLPPLEAMACGVPVITSKNSSLPEVVGDAAILVDPLKVDEMVDALLELARDLSLRERTRQSGLERAQSFSWEISAKETLEIYEKTLG